MGREAELALFAGALDAEVPPFHVAHVTGPGGIGKTALLDEIALLAHARDVPVAHLDARDIRPTPEEFAAAAAAVLPEAAGRRVLLVDTYERIASLDGWLRRSFVPALDAGALVVLAGRHRPSPDWRAGWAGEATVVSLRNLSPADAEALLDGRGVGAEARPSVLAFTHGHPLALTLAAEWLRQRAAAAFDPAEAPGLLGDLLARFAEDVPTPAHRAALEGGALVRSVTVPLLEALLPRASGDGMPALAFSAEELFGWLRTLAFTEADAAGLRLHDVVRETIEADLRWRDAPRHDAFHGRARRYYAERLRTVRDREARRLVLSDFLHLYRHHPVAKPLLQRLRDSWVDADLGGSGPLREGDAEAVRAMVARHAGEAEAEAVGRWLARRPEAAEVFHRTDGTVQGVLLTLPLDGLSPEERRADPVVAAVWNRVGGRLRAGERGLVFRTWMDADAGQGVSPVQSLVFAHTVGRYLSTPGLATSVLLTARPEIWEPVFALVGLRRWPEAEAADRETPLAAFGVDWRATPPEAWLDALAGRAPSEPLAMPPDESLVVLSEEGFAEAVREALKAVARPHRLAESPLLHARLVREQPGEPVEVLASLLSDAARQLDDGVRERPYFRALDLTYFRPAPTQAIAAERLDLPFSTYRRHLRRGIEHVVDVLWRAEVGG